MRIYRKDNWPSKLEAVRETYENNGFEWGVTDCCCFVTDCIASMTGVNVMGSHRSAYRTRLEALKVIACYDGMENMFEARLKAVGAFKTIPTLLARGDVVLVETDDGLAGGIWFGHYALAPQPDKGLCKVPICLVKKAWGIV